MGRGRIESTVTEREKLHEINWRRWKRLAGLLRFCFTVHHVHHGCGAAASYLLPGLLRDQGPEVFDVDDGAVELVAEAVEVAHADLAEVARMVLVEEDAVMAHSRLHSVQANFMTKTLNIVNLYLFILDVDIVDLVLPNPTITGDEMAETFEHGYPDPDEENRLKENKKKDPRALVIIQQAVHDSVFSRIAATTTSKQAWSILRKEFQDSRCSNHMTGMNSLFKELDETQKLKVQLGNGKEMQIEEKVQWVLKLAMVILYNPFSGKIFIRRDVVFDENASWDWHVSDVKMQQPIPRPNGISSKRANSYKFAGSFHFGITKFINHDITKLFFYNSEPKVFIHS
ncbi:hypothetical protein RJ639_017267 [Escallonia herrerae]|uniref:Uncharacterized protein n=1 Tax=Escallonia herrerae TaxID=1293975 RepID=A0AA89AKF3_9ASTE|nr:hypothetical protein RJ639_017267 [Escallonia herrerae]